MTKDKMILLAALFALCCIAIAGMGCAGPSKARLRVLLGEFREQNRERERIIHEYEAAKCDGHPEQRAGVLNFGEAGF